MTQIVVVAVSTYIFALMSGLCIRKRMTEHIACWPIDDEELSNKTIEKKKRMRERRRTKCTQETTTNIDGLSMCTYV